MSVVEENKQHHILIAGCGIVITCLISYYFYKKNSNKKSTKSDKEGRKIKKKIKN